jgi:hypothetical protein
MSYRDYDILRGKLMQDCTGLSVNGQTRAADFGQAGIVDFGNPL